MAKRKSGRPRKDDQYFANGIQQPVSVKRKPGRPRKIAAVETKPSTKAVAEYAIETGDNFHVVEADGFAIASNGDLCMTRGDELVAAFRGWESIVKSEKEAVEPPKAELPEVTLSAAQPENVPNTTGYQFQATSAELLAGSAFQNAWPPNGDLNQALHQANGVAGLEVPSAVDASAGLAGGINGPSPE